MKLNRIIYPPKLESDTSNVVQMPGTVIEIAPAPPPPDPFYYTGMHYLADTGTEFVPIGRASLRHRLRSLGGATEISDAICRIEDERHVVYAGPLAGKDRGLHKSADGRNMLATVSPEIISAVQGDWPTIGEFLRALLAAGDHDQRPYFYGWLQSARVAMLTRKPSPGHLLGLAGCRGCGKTQLIDTIIQQAMGGRRANPRDYFCGGQFNGDLVAAELLVMDDEDIPAKQAARQAFKQRVKNFLYSGAPRIEAKRRDAFVFKGLWRGVVACNDAEDDLRALPAIDSGTRDKLMYLLCETAFPALVSDEEFRAWRDTIAGELPGFLHHVESYRIPDEIRGSRGRVQAWQHPTILEKIHSLDGWLVLLELIDTAAGTGDLPLPWRGKARELETLLTEHSETRRHANKLFGDWHGKCGALLAEASGHTERVYESGARDGVNLWRIEPGEDRECEWLEQ